MSAGILLAIAFVIAAATFCVLPVIERKSHLMNAFFFFPQEAQVRSYCQNKIFHIHLLAQVNPPDEDRFSLWEMPQDFENWRK